MELLYLLESIRNPVADFIVSILTYLGDEPIFLVLGLFIYWCVDKYEGYYLMAVGFLGTAINQLMKISFRVPRPWVLDKNFTIVESAREAASGYSFPSGHTQFAVGSFSGLAIWNKKTALRIVCIAICVLVPFSRMYLGVHTPLDVGVGAVCALVLSFGLYPIFKRARENAMIVPVFMAGLALFLAFGLVYVYAWNFPSDTDTVNLMEARKNIWTLLGSIIGMFAAYMLDAKYVRFETKAHPLGQALKTVLGIALALALKEGLKPILKLVFGEALFAHSIRYAIMVFVACGLWPMTFKFFAKLGKNK